MSENWNFDRLNEEHLAAVIDHAQSQIDMWTHRQQVALGRLARLMSGYEYPTYPTDLEGQL